MGKPDKLGSYVYGHHLGTRVLCEAAASAAADAELRAAAERAVKWTVEARNDGLGWRYGAHPGDNDTSITALAVLALCAARDSGMEIAPGWVEGSTRWFDKATNEEWGKTGYTQKGDNGARLPEAKAYQPTEAMTAAALAARFRMGASADSAIVMKGIALLINQPPKWAPKDGNDFYYWYYGTLATAQAGGATWAMWRPKAIEALTPNQKKVGHAEGSWDPCDAWGPAGGRVYATAMNAMTLAICVKYPSAPLAKKK